jgi:hypothetical protein
MMMGTRSGRRDRRTKISGENGVRKKYSKASMLLRIKDLSTS